MQITAFSDYALRVLLYLGLQPPDRLTTIGEIAQAYHIPQNHLMKVVHLLGQKGYVETKRGKGGGIRLLFKPESIIIGKVLRDTEDNLNLVECFNPDLSRCTIQSACRLQWVLYRGLEAMLTELDKYTLAQMLEPGNELKKLLGQGPD